MIHRDNELVNKFLLHQLMELKVRLGMWARAVRGSQVSIFECPLCSLQGTYEESYENITDSVNLYSHAGLILCAEILDL